MTLQLVIRSLFSLCLLFTLKGTTSGHELRGFIELESRLFLNSPIHDGQRNHDFSLVAAPQYYHQFDNRSVVSFIPYFRGDSADNRRTHFDVRELIYIWPKDFWEVRAGAGKVFWGVTESQHLVDIVNQTDAVENVDGEDKLGQPMVNLSFASKWGSLDFFVLPYFRERTFPGYRGRLRPSIAIDVENAEYESAAKQWHSDFAVRYSHTIGKWDFGLSHFIGTGREPTIRLGFDGLGRPFLFPYYEQINQTGIDSNFVSGSWIWKLEAIHRRGQADDDFFAWTAGFEYTFSGLLGTGMDLGVLTEWSHDTRGKKATTPFQNDLAFGLRLGVNDVEGTELLLVLSQDLKANSQVMFLEASTRLTEHWRLTADVWVFSPDKPQDLLYSVRRDDFFRVGLAYHF